MSNFVDKSVSVLEIKVFYVKRRKFVRFGRIKMNNDIIIFVKTGQQQKCINFIIFYLF